MNKCSNYLSGTDPVPDNIVTPHDPNTYNVLPQDNEKVLCEDKADFDLSMKELISNEEADCLSGTVSEPINSVESNYVSPQIVYIEDQLVVDDEIIYLGGTDSEPKNTYAFNDPTYVISPKKIKVLCEHETLRSALSVEEFTLSEETDILNDNILIDSTSVSLDTVKNEDPSFVAVQEVASNEEIIYLGGLDSVAQKIMMPEDCNYVLHQDFDHSDSVPQNNLTPEVPTYIPPQHLLTSDENLSGTNSVPQNSDPGYVSLQLVADIVEQLISNEKNMYLDSTDSMPKKTSALMDLNNVPIPLVLSSNEKTDYLSGTDSVHKESSALMDLNVPIPPVLSSNETTDYLSGTDSVHKESSALMDLNNVPIPPVLSSNEKTDYLSGTNLVHKESSALMDLNVPIPPVLSYREKTDSVPKNTVSLDDPNYGIPCKKLKFLCKNETTDCDSSEKNSTSNTDTDYLNDASSLPQNTVKLEDPSYVSPQVVADIVDQLISDEIIYLGSTNSVQQKTTMPVDCNYARHQVDFHHTDSASLKTNKIKDDPDYVPPQQVFENEKDDIVDPRWETVRELTSNEERYKQVKACWGSSTVPDPDKNLTYHSFRRKKILRDGEVKPRAKQHKRKASSTLTSETKRPCTYLVDKEIKEIVRQKEAKSREIQNEMNRVLDELRERHYHEEIRYGDNMAFNYRSGGNSHYARTYQNTILSNLRLEHQRELNYVQNKYHQKTYDCTSKFDPKLNDLENIRQEVLQFYTFYKGMGINIEKDPTVLTEFQLKVINDIENFYKQMNSFYK